MKTKICSTCKDPKPTVEFSPKFANNPKGRRNSVCRKCISDYGKVWHQKNKKANLKRLYFNKKANQEKAFSYLKIYLQSHPCVDCGESDLKVLDFDHIQGKKRDSVVKMAWNGLSLSVIKHEVSKCEVRCANDHRRRTYQGNVGKWRNG